MNWYKQALTEKQFYEFYAYSGLTEEDLKNNPVLLFNMIEHLNYIRKYYLNYFLKEIPEELKHARWNARMNEETLDTLSELIATFDFHDFEEAILYFSHYIWEEGMGGAPWAEIAQWVDRLWKIGEISQEVYSIKLMKHILELIFIIDTIHSLQHNTNIALVDLPQQEKIWLRIALEIAKHTETPYQMAQLSKNKELIQHLRTQDQLQQKPTQSQNDIYVHGIQKFIYDYLTERDFEESADKIYVIVDQIIRVMNANIAIHFAQALQNIEISLNNELLSTKNRMSNLLKFIAPYIVARDWFRENLYIFKLYLDLYDTIYLDEELLDVFLRMYLNANPYNYPEGFDIADNILEYLRNSKYAYMLESLGVD